MSRKVAIIGYARQGKSAAAYYQSLGDDVSIHDIDTSIEVPEGIRTILGEKYLQNLDEYDLILRTPRLHPNQIVDANNENILKKVSSVTNEFMKLLKGKVPVIGITGTKGKGTTTLLCEAILKEANKNVVVCGNIGIAPFDVLEKALLADIVVMELANFQTIDMDISPQVGVILKITPEHLDWHTDFTEYVNAKKHMIVNQTSKDLVIGCTDNDGSLDAISGTKADKRFYSTESKADFCVSNEDLIAMGEVVAKVSDVNLLGRHNLENVCASIGATWEFIGGDKDAIVRALHLVKGFQYRLEPLGEKHGVNYINDAFSSAPESTIAAINSINTPVILIVGGYNKKSDYTELAKSIADKQSIHTLIYIGATGPSIVEKVQQMRNIRAVDGGQKMEDIFNVIAKTSSVGDTVLFSTACASFGMFKDFFDRGEQFEEAFNKL
jgi:UDP-N-acetylmuramoylalanine--D-glutamate ligase